jgi:uncharacterized membrane protein
MAKTATFGVMHLGIAFSVSYVLSGDIAIAGAITFVEPLCNTVAHYFFDKYWDDPRVAAWRRRRGRRRTPGRTGAVPAAAR